MKEISDIIIISGSCIVQKLIYLGKDNILYQEHIPHHSVFLLLSQRGIANSLTRPR